ncbi:MAG: nodulation protein NfeD [Thermodesulfobacteriota bacterium]|nr:nodulation protein NfeD [Thermodesulfobacteriota bacterium]
MRNRMRTYIVLLAVIALLLAGGVVQSFGEEEKSVFDVITIDSAITPPVADYVIKSIELSHVDNSAGIIILLDTPGGLDLAMRDIVKKLLSPPLPVVVFVHPSGARAASAGVMITMAAPLAAMAPGTNIGAAHPVAIGIGGKMDETMAKKVENDAVAYARGIAQKRMRNADWAEKAVRESVSIPAEEALSLNVVDIIASDIKDLLHKIDGTTIVLPSGDVTLDTEGAVINKRDMGLREKILVTISNPNIAYLLMMIGLAGLYFEFANPGAILPGVVGGISLILAFFAMQTLPVNYAGVALIIFGIILFIAEIKIVSHGMLSVAGVISLALGSVMLFESSAPALRVSLGVMIPTIIIVSLFFIAVVSLAVKAQMKKPFTGVDGMIGREGKTITPVYADGKVFVKGERWNACSGELIEEGTDIRVVGIEGLRLKVKRI